MRLYSWQNLTVANCFKLEGNNVGTLYHVGIEKVENPRRTVTIKDCYYKESVRKKYSACCFGEEPPYEAICCNKVEFTGGY